VSPSHVAEPTYEAIRKRLMAGTWPMGFRLEAIRLAEDLGVSISPVRDGLNRLVGERLVDLVPGIGFHVPRLTEAMLRDLLDLNMLLLLSAVRLGASTDGASIAASAAESHADRTGALFARIASLNGNSEVVETVRIVGARLHATRSNEVAILPTAPDELESIRIAAELRTTDLVGLLMDYHEARKQYLDRFLAQLQVGRAI